MLGSSDLALAIGTAATSLLWLLAAGVLYVLRKPPELATGPPHARARPGAARGRELPRERLPRPVRVTGPILRLRSFGDDDGRRYYVAVDDGSSRLIRAWRVRPGQYSGLEQGVLVTASVTPNLGCVRWLYRAAGDE